MDWLKSFFLGSIDKVLRLPFGVSVLQFLATLFDAAKDGSISAQEWHTLALSLSGADIGLIGLAMWLLKKID